MWERFLKRDGSPVPAPPPGIHVAKGSVHVALTRGFVQYILHNETAQQFLEWVQQTRVADETYFASLNHSPALRIPGSPTGNRVSQTYFLPILHSPACEFKGGKLFSIVTTYKIQK